MKHVAKWRCLSVLAALAVGPLAVADQIVFKNGDKVTGKIETMEGGKVTIKSAVAGKITIEMKDIATFSTDVPIEVRLIDGTVLHQAVTAAGEGNIGVGRGDVKTQPLPLASIKSINPALDTWTGSLTLGGMLARGNTTSETLDTALHLVRRGEKDRITFDGGYDWGRQHVSGLHGQHETENDWFVSPKYDYFFTEKFYGYANARIERDLIAGLSLLFTPGVGVGYQWVERPDFHVSTEAGASWLYRDFRNDGTTETAAVRLAYHIDKKCNDRVAAFHNFEYFPGLDRLDNYFFDTDAGVRVTLTEKMFAELKGDFKYNSVPAPGKGNSDTRFIVGVGWNF